MTGDNSSSDSMIQASKSRVKVSGHGKSIGAGGHRIDGRSAASDFLSHTGETYIFDTQEHGYEKFKIGAAWDVMSVPRTDFIGKLLKLKKKAAVDLDIGCLYELQNGRRGAIQAFGEMYGDYDGEPFISLSGDERTGEAEGHDEMLSINGEKWPEIKRLLLYVYIYKGVPNWHEIKPEIVIDMPGENDLMVIPDVNDSHLAVCVIGGLENIRNGIRITNYTEFFPGHDEMDRAFGFGLQWEDGKKPRL